MRNLGNFEAKFFEIKLKKNWKLSDFLEFFDMDEASFKQRLKSVLSSKSYKYYMRKIQSNSKIKVSETSKDIQTVNVVDEKNDTVDVEENVEENISIEEVTSMIEQLEVEKDQLSQTQQKYIAQKEEVFEKLDQSQKALEEIKKSLSAHELIIQSCTDKLSNLSERIEKLEAQKEKLELKKRELFEKKEELEKIVISVINDVIVCDIDVPDDWKKMMNRLTSLDGNQDSESERLYEVIEMMSLKNIRVISKIFSIVELIMSDKKKFKIVFDSESDLCVALQMLDFFEIEVM